MIRNAETQDTAGILSLIKELAAYEREPDAVVNTEQELAYSLFEEEHCHALVWEDNHHGIVAFALYYFGYSTWKGKTLYLEDLYVKPEFRRQNIGGQLFKEVVRIAKQTGVRRMDWQVLNWNEPAIKFYKKQNALLDPQWINCRLYF